MRKAERHLHAYRCRETARRVCEDERSTACDTRVRRGVRSDLQWATMSCPLLDCCHVRHLLELDEDIERRAASAVGTVLDRKWRLDRLLGCGGMGAVYAATHRNGTRAAVKVLLPEAALSPVLRPTAGSPVPVYTLPQTLTTIAEMAQQDVTHGVHRPAVYFLFILEVAKRRGKFPLNA